MTNEEAKRRLEVWLKCMDCPEDKQCYDSHLHSTCEYTDYCDETPVSEAVKVAIEALEQQPCEDMPCVTPEEMQKCKDIVKKYTSKIQQSDIISREDRLIDLANAIENDDSGYWTNDRISTVLRNTASLPPVTPQPKTGRWVKNDWTPICSCCGKYKYEDIDGSIYDDVWFPNYCPNCGARMVEPQESEKALDTEGVLDKIKAEIESNMESIIGKYDSSIPKSNMPSYKIERNKVRKECISIIDKYR